MPEYMMASPDRPPATLNGADWGRSDAKHLMVQDMIDGLVPCDKPIKDITRLYNDMYAHQPEFKNFPFDAVRYKDRVGRIQKTVKRLKWAAAYDKECLDEARKKYPQQSHGPTGTILWEGSEAARLLEIDMAAGKHLVPNFKPGDLWETKDEYKKFTKRRFSKRIDQKKEAAKPYGENPAMVQAKREKKQIRKIKNRPQISRAGMTNPYKV